jgi:hypothetical protein
MDDNMKYHYDKLLSKCLSVEEENNRLKDELNQMYFSQEKILKERDSYRRLYLKYA